MDTKVIKKPVCNKSKTNWPHRVTFDYDQQDEGIMKPNLGSNMLWTVNSDIRIRLSQKITLSFYQIGKFVSAK